MRSPYAEFHCSKFSRLGYAFFLIQKRSPLLCIKITNFPAFHLSAYVTSTSNLCAQFHNLKLVWLGWALALVRIELNGSRNEITRTLAELAKNGGDARYKKSNRQNQKQVREKYVFFDLTKEFSPKINN